MNIDKLIGVVPDFVIKELPYTIVRFRIDTPLRLSHFLAQCFHESNGFRCREENLNYSDVNRIAQIFKHDVDSDKDHVIEPHEIEFAKKFVHNPVGLGNFVYANQNGNGDEKSGDGYKHRGFGFIETTGKANQEAFFKSINLPTNSDPSLIGSEYPLLSAAFFWETKHLNAIADLGSDSSVVEKVTKIVNGGLIGIAYRISEFNRFYSLLK